MVSADGESQDFFSADGESQEYDQSSRLEASQNCASTNRGEIVLPVAQHSYLASRECQLGRPTDDDTKVAATLVARAVSLGLQRSNAIEAEAHFASDTVDRGCERSHQVPDVDRQAAIEVVAHAITLGLLKAQIGTSWQDDLETASSSCLSDSSCEEHLCISSSVDGCDGLARRAEFLQMLIPADSNSQVYAKEVVTRAISAGLLNSEPRRTSEEAQNVLQPASHLNEGCFKTHRPLHPTAVDEGRHCCDVKEILSPKLLCTVSENSEYESSYADLGSPAWTMQNTPKCMWTPPCWRSSDSVSDISTATGSYANHTSDRSMWSRRSSDDSRTLADADDCYPVAWKSEHPEESPSANANVNVESRSNSSTCDAHAGRHETAEDASYLIDGDLRTAACEKDASACASPDIDGTLQRESGPKITDASEASDAVLSASNASSASRVPGRRKFSSTCAVSDRCSISSGGIVRGEDSVLSDCGTLLSDCGTLLSEEEPRPPKTRSRGLQLFLGQGEAVATIIKGFQTRWESSDAFSADILGRAKKKLDIDNVRMMSRQEFDEFLLEYGVDLEAEKARSSRDLWFEVIWQTCKLEKYKCKHGPGGYRIRRICQLLIVELEAEIDGDKRFLLMSAEGHRQSLNQRLTAKMFDDETHLEAFGRCMLQNFSLPEKKTREHLGITGIAHHVEVRDSAAYPGLSTTYEVHTLQISIKNPSDPALSVIGLPSGSEFKTVLVGQNRERTWNWVSQTSYAAAKDQTMGAVTRAVKQTDGSKYSPAEDPHDRPAKKCCTIS